MKTKEMIEVYADIKDGKTVCICKRDRKRCGKSCTPDVVERDKFRDWEDGLWRDKYGQGR